MSLKKTLAAAVAAAATLTVAGCGSATDISGSPVAVANLTSSGFATALTSAISHAKSVHIAGTLEAQGQTLTVTGDQSFGDHTFTGMAGAVTISTAGMGSFEARIVHGIVYVNGARLGFGRASGKPWLKLDLTDPQNPLSSLLGQITDTLGPGQLTGMLKGLSTVAAVGPETVDGTPTTHYRVSVDTAKLGSKLGLDPSRLHGAALPKTVRYDVWLDSRSRPVRVSLKTAELGADLHFSKWDQPVHVVPPPASQVSSFGR
jgi:hypothetical protein